MRIETIVAVIAAIAAIASFLFFWTQILPETTLQVAKLESEVRRLEEQIRRMNGGVVAVSTQTASADDMLLKATETGRYYRGFRVRTCPEGFLNSESDRIEGISAWCIKK